MQAVITWEQYKLNHEHGTTIGQRLDDLGKRVIKENRHFIKTIVEVILFCAQQEIALRGHVENEESLNPGNFQSLLKLVGTHDGVVRERLEESPGNAKYTSPEVQNELLVIMGEMVLEKICEEVRKAGIY